VPAHAGAANLPTGFSDQQMASSLDGPTGIAEVPDPAAFTTRRVLFVEQRTARVGLIAGASVFTVGTVPGVASADMERGLLGIVVDPGWPARPYVYVHCTDARSGNSIAISRFTLTGDLAYAGDGALQFDAASRYDLRADFPDDAPNHNGGSVRFGADGKLYVGLGDDASGCPAQDLTVAVGKILRLEVSHLPAGPGGPAPFALLTPADKPFVTSADSIARLVYVEGLRNPFRFSIDAPTGALVIGDVGQDAWEEIDIAPTGGMDMGWPYFEGRDAYTTCVLDPPVPVTGPIATLEHPTGEAIIGGPRYRRPATGALRFPPEYEGDIFFLDYYGGMMRRLAMGVDTWYYEPAAGQPDSIDWGTGFDAVSDVIELSDGSLWYCRQSQGLNASGEIRRIVYTDTVSTPPATPGLVLGTPYPNPGRDGAIVTWTQPRAARVTLAVFGPDGRRVRTLLAGFTLGAGPQRAAWDGRDDAGRAQRSGLYFLRIEVAGERRSVRLALRR
jgi:glucose/arabinose dehydrogenase